MIQQFSSPGLNFAMASVRLLTLLTFTMVSTVSAQLGAMQMAEGLSPRYYLAGSAQLADRQNECYACKRPASCAFWGLN
jgi:hypothetical protein